MQKNKSHFNTQVLDRFQTELHKYLNEMNVYL